MNQNFPELDAMISRFSMNIPKSKKAKQALAHEVDQFLSNYQYPKQNYPALHDVRKALKKANLPLTSYIFEQETGLIVKESEEPKPFLQLSPSISITISERKPKRETQATECNIISYENQKLLKKKMVHSLEGIRDDLTQIADKHAKYEKRRHQLIKKIEML